MCARARRSRCSTATAWTASGPVVLPSPPASLSKHLTYRSPAPQGRTQFVPVAAVSRLAASAPIVAPLYSRKAKLLQNSCPFAFLRWTARRSFSRCWTSGHPVRNPGFASVRKSLTILSRLNQGIEPSLSCRHPLKSTICSRKPAQLERRDSNHAFIRRRHYSWRMLFLSAFARLVPREPEPNDLLAQHAAIGHLGLTLIALVFVLVTFWKS
jgi:hypothetical protein